MSAWIIPIIDQVPGHEKKVYFEEIVKQLTDTAFIGYLRERYKYDMAEAVTLSTDLELLSASGKRTNFKDLLAKYRGKMIYVDFWASWCAPCMADMPEARKLRHRYEGSRDVVFIYLSLDKQEQAWSNSIENALLVGVEDNYRILNIDSASLLKQIQLNTIPRCLLYDREGRLAYKDAPRASSPQIGGLLDNCINEKKGLR